MTNEDNVKWVVLWNEDGRRCEYRRMPDGSGWLELYENGKVILTRPLRTSDEPLALAETWRQSMAAGLDGCLPAEPSRRIVSDRRGSHRGGRRSDDSEGEPPVTN